MTRTMVPRFILALLFAALVAAPGLPLLAPSAHAQIGLSGRIQGLGADFDGIVDDAITDAARNPARLGGINGRQFYLTRPTGWVSYLRLPRWRSSGGFGTIVPTEGYYNSLSFDEGLSVDRVRATYFTPIAGDMQSSFSVDMGAYGSDDGSGFASLSETTRFVIDGITAEEGASARRRDSRYAVFDAAVATTRDPDASALGVRFSVEYLSDEESEFRENSALYWPKTDASEQVLEYGLYKENESHEQFGASATVGWFRPSGVVREVSLRAGGTRLSRDVAELDQDIFDEDVDGNGLDPSGVFPIYVFELDEIESERDLSGGSVVGRLLLDYGDRWRSVHRFGGTILSGDGAAAYASDDTDRDAGASTRLVQGARYTYDTSVTRVAATSVVGYVDELVEDVRFALALRADYSRDEFDEDASGTGQLEFEDGAQTVRFDSPYDQHISFTDEELRAAVTVAAEWTLPKYLTFRMRLRYGAERREYSMETDRRVDTSGTDLEAFNTGRRRSTGVDWDTDFGHGAGVSVRLEDRLFVDLYSSSLNFTGFSYGSLRWVL